MLLHYGVGFLKMVALSVGSCHCDGCGRAGWGGGVGGFQLDVCVFEEDR